MPPPALGVLTASGGFVFFAAMFAVPSGYSYGGVLLLVASVWFLAQRPRLNLSGEDRLMVVVLLVYFVVSSVMTGALSNNPKDYDQYSRALLAVPILLLCCGVPIRLSILWAGIILGSVLSAPLAWWQVEVLGDVQAGGFLNEIIFSNLTLVFAIFCAGGLFWAPPQGRHARAWRAAFVLGMLCGLYSAVVGGSRGSWVAAIPVVALFLFTFLSRRNARRVVGGVGAGVAVLAILFAWPDSPLHVRYQQGVNNINQYEAGNSANSLGARLEMWHGAWLNLQRKPVSGWNAEDYAAALERQIAQGESAPVVLKYADNLHNNYLQAWVFTGLPGLLSLLALYTVPLWQFGRRLRDADITVRVLAFCGASLVVSYMCFSLTYSALRRNYGIMFYLLALVIFWGVMRYRERQQEA